VAGLLSLLPAEKLAGQLNKLKDAIVSLGVTGREPLLKITGLALPVIPYARISDMGLVDVENQTLVPLFVD
jgi:adenine deaminase